MASNKVAKMLHFSSTYSEILQRVDAIDPTNYARTRNFIDGNVSYLSPYISRGIISSEFVLQRLLAKGYKVFEIEKFIQELAWRDYWQQVWVAKGDTIDSDLKHPQPEVENYELPRAIIDAKTKIKAIDQAITDFYDTGYLHNHVRMYVAAIACNMGKSHWKLPAQWMYYNLLDADWASNALSWQWVAGSNSNKKYVANQENINKYCRTAQKDTFLDISYKSFETMAIPNVLSKTTVPIFKTSLPKQKQLDVKPELPTLVYNFYNLDPKWRTELVGANRVLLLEPSHFLKYPIGENSMNFMLALGKNIQNLQVYVGEFNELTSAYGIGDVYYKEHPTNTNYKGNEDSREWMFGVTGYFPSFFAFWKKCKKELKY